MTGKIPISELKKLSSMNPPVGKIIKTLLGDRKEVNPQELNLVLLKNYLPGKIPLGKVLLNLIQVLYSISKTEQIHQANSSLMTAIKSLILSADNVDDNFLKEFIDKTGLNYEADLKKLVMSKTGRMFLEESGKKSNKLQINLRESLQNSVKGQLIKLVQVLETKLKIVQKDYNYPGLKEFQSLLESIKSTISNIELNQIMNYYARKEYGFFQFQIPSSISETIHLYVKNNSTGNKQKAKKKEDISLVFLLNLKEMGNLRVDVRIVDKNLSCHFYVEEKGVSIFITTMLSEFKSKLESNYKVIHLSCDLRDKKFFQEEKPDKNLFRKKRQIINIQV